MFVCIYVDDLLIIGNNKVEISLFKCKMKEVFEMEDLRPLTYFLGMEFKFKKLFDASNEVYYGCFEEF